MSEGLNLPLQGKRRVTCTPLETPGVPGGGRRSPLPRPGMKGPRPLQTQHPSRQTTSDSLQLVRGFFKNQAVCEGSQALPVLPWPNLSPANGHALLEPAVVQPPRTPSLGPHTCLGLLI